VLVAYLDEFGHVGPYISPTHRKYNDHPIFGYGGYIIPASQIRSFGSSFERVKDKHFKTEIQAAGAHPRRWEKKGSDLLTEGSWSLRRQEIKRKFSYLSARLKQCGGEFFYYGELKPLGTAKETRQSAIERSASILIQTIRNLSYVASKAGKNMFVFLDQVDTNNHAHAITNMAGFLYSKDSPASTRRIVEVPMQLESERYGAMQFADWYCALLSRTTYSRFVETDRFAWSPRLFESTSLDSGLTSKESRIWIPEREKHISTRNLSDPSWKIYTKPH